MLNLHPSEDSERNHQHPSTSIVPISLWWLCWIWHSDLKSCPIEPGTKKRRQCLIMCLISGNIVFFSIVFPNFPCRRLWVTWWIFILYVHSAKPFFSHVGPGTNQVVDFWDLFFFAAATFHAQTHTHSTHTHTLPSRVSWCETDISHTWTWKLVSFQQKYLVIKKKLTVASRVR